MSKPLAELRRVRVEKLEELRQQGVEPYPAYWSPLRERVSVEVVQEGSFGKEFVVAGRLVGWREHGSIIFADLQDDSDEVQICFKKDQLGDSKFEILNLFDQGDFLGIKGVLFKTRAGERTLQVKEYKLLSKSLRPIPSDWFGLEDTETRYRKRYLDFIANPELKDLFRRKALFWNSMREFLQERGFLEVYTPVLEVKAGGADANPFVTHHEALDIDLYLRISMGELWQKRLMVGGYEKTFEIGRQFRNEGIDREHLQDYVQMEFYWAYADYEKGMELVKQMYQYVAEKTFGSSKFEIAGHKFDLSDQWEKIDYREILVEEFGLDVDEAGRNDLMRELDRLDVDYKKDLSWGRLVDSLWKECRKEISGPAFLVNHPVQVSPLAKRRESDPRRVERFQVVLGGSEVGNGYSELNDPLDQAERFKKQAELREAGDKEAQMEDKDFVEALEYGMPPTCGFGVSVRLFSFLAGLPIKECVMFPLMRPKAKG